MLDAILKCTQEKNKIILIPGSAKECWIFPSWKRYKFLFVCTKFYNRSQSLSLQIARLVHVADDALDGDVADRFAEKQFFDCRRGDGAQGGQKEQKAAETERLVRIGRRDVAT